MLMISSAMSLLTNFRFRWLVLLLVCIDICKPLDQSGNYCRYRKFSKNGTIKLNVVIGLHENANGQCGEISPYQFPLVVAVDWITNLLNGNGTDDLFIPGISIGFDIYDNCDNPSLTTDLMLDAQDVTSSAGILDCTEQPQTSNSAAATIISASVESTKVISELLPSNHLLLRPLPSSPGLKSLPNLLQTSPSPTSEVETLVNLLLRLQWNFVALISTDDENGQSAREEIKYQAMRSGICVNFDYVLPIVKKDTQTVQSAGSNIINSLEGDLLRSYEENLTVVFIGPSWAAATLLQNEIDRHDQYPNTASGLHWIFLSDVIPDTGILSKLKTLAGHFSENRPFLSFHISPPKYDFNDFRQFWFAKLESVDSGNTSLQPWIDQYKSDVCVPTGCKDTIFTSDLYCVSNIIDAVYSVAATIKTLHSEKCLEWNPGMCAGLESVIKNGVKSKAVNIVVGFDQINSSFLPLDYIGSGRILQFSDEGHVLPNNAENVFDVSYFNQTSSEYRKVGSYDDSSFVLNTDQLPYMPSVCGSSEHCPYCREQLYSRISYMDGEFLLLGLFSINTAGSDPYSCGSYRHFTNDAITVSSFMESIKSLNKNTSQKFGGIALNDCYSPYNTTSYLAEFFSKKVRLSDPVTGQIIDPDKVIVVIGALSSPVSVIVADQVMALGIPMISYGASSSELDNSERYPYFLRTVPSDTLQVEGMVKLVTELQFTHVGAIYIDDSYGKYGIKAFKEKASASGICVEDELAVSEDDSDSELRYILETIYNTQSKVVVYFGIDSIAKKILDMMENEFSGEEPLVFISSEAWGTNEKIAVKQSKGSLVFVTDVSNHVDESFRVFLRNLGSNDTSNNPWVPRYFEDRIQCNFLESFDKNKGLVCPKDIVYTLDDETIAILFNDQRGVHVNYAVHAAGQGFIESSKQICNRVTLCEQFRKSPEVITSSIIKVHLGDKGNLKPFMDDGNGNIGFTIYNIQRTQDGTYVYTEVGTYNQQGVLNLNKDLITFYDIFGQPIRVIDSAEVRCDNFPNCQNICKREGGESTSTAPMPIVSTQKTTESDTNKILFIMTIVFGAIVGVLLVALILLIVVLLRRQGGIVKEPEQNHHPSLRGQTSKSSANLYDEPGPIGSFDNPAFNTGSMSAQTRRRALLASSMESLHSERPIQYSHIRQSSNPEIREFRTKSRLSSPSSIASVSPTVSRLFTLGQRSHSKSSVTTPTSTRRTAVAPSLGSPSHHSKPRNQVDESHYTIPNTHQPEGYIRPISDLLTPDSPLENDVFPHNDAVGSAQPSKPHTITYLTAKDLIQSDEEEDADSIKRNNSLEFQGAQSDARFPASVPVHERRSRSFDAGAFLSAQNGITSVPHTESNVDNVTINFNKRRGSNTVEFHNTSNTFPRPKTNPMHAMKVTAQIENSQNFKNVNPPTKVQSENTTFNPTHTQRVIDRTIQNSQMHSPAAILKPAETTNHKGQIPYRNTLALEPRGRTSISSVPDVIRHGIYDIGDEEQVVMI